MCRLEATPLGPANAGPRFHRIVAFILPCRQLFPFCHIIMLFDFGIKGQVTATGCI